MSENDIVQAIIQYITMLGGIAIRINSGTRLIQNSDGSTRIFRGAPKGTADILGVLNGIPLAIECKDRRGKTTPEQEQFLQEWREAGGLGIVARSIDDVEAALKERMELCQR
jgi:Holliday junction resolvase